MSYTAAIEIEWTEDEANGLWEAILGNITYSMYWATLQVDSDRQTIWVHERHAGLEADEAETLTLPTLFHGLVKAATDLSATGAAIRSYAIRALTGHEPGHVDADLTDVIIQLAYMGEVRYG